MADIDMNNQLFDGIAKFAGILDGNNRKITNLNINSSNLHNVGLVRELLDGGKIQNLTIESGSVKGHLNVGAFVGRVNGRVELIGVVNKATVSLPNVTGLGGFGSGGISSEEDRGSTTIKNSKNYGDITGNSSSGGIIGRSYHNTVLEDTRNEGKIISEYSDAGGIIGDASYTTIEKAENIGTVTASGNRSEVGGIAGEFSYGTITREC